jgi:4-hydroxy-tetrahydrodipicolinate reductase
MMRIAIAGASGRMGQAIAARALAAGHRIVGGSEREGAAAIGAPLGEGVISADAALAGAAGEVWIDFTTPAASLAALSALPACRDMKAVILGTTGFSQHDHAAIAAAAQRFAVVKSGNFSLGVAVLCALARKAAASLPDWDIEILEAHHRHKQDAPSGTALMIAEAMADGRGKDLAELRLPHRDGQTGPRPDGGIGFAVVRAGGIVGQHTALLANEREVLMLSHQAGDRTIFADGAIAAAAWALKQKPGLYDMNDVIGL